MKQMKFIIANAAVRQNVLREIQNIEPDGSMTVTVGSTGSKSSRQRGLQHIWYTDIVRSGLGGKYEEDEEILDLYCKHKWGVRILCEDDNFAELFLSYSTQHKSDPGKMKWFVKNHVHTEQMTNNQMAQFLTEIRDHYAQLGVNLTDPDARGWDKLLEQAA